MGGKSLHDLGHVGSLSDDKLMDSPLELNESSSSGENRRFHRGPLNGALNWGTTSNRKQMAPQMGPHSTVVEWLIQIVKLCHQIQKDDVAGVVFALQPTWGIVLCTLRHTPHFLINSNAHMHLLGN